MAFNWQKQGYFLIGLLSFSIVLFWGVTRPPFFAIDDAYITYRYAENLQQGIGLVYNAGEPVLGTTAPMYAMILALLSFILPDIELLGHWLSIVAWGSATLMALLLLLQMNRPLAAAIAPVLLALQPTILKSVGMETPFLLFLMFLVAWAWLGGRMKTAVLAGAIMLITRQDSALWLFILGLAVWQWEKRLPWREAAWIVGLTLPWFAIAWWQFGAILPNSATAKIGQTSVMVVGSVIPFWQQFGLLLTSRALPLVAILLVTAVLAWLLNAVITRQGTGWWLMGWVLAYTAVYSHLNVLNFNWYFVPPVAVTMLLVALGLEALSRGVQQLALKIGARRAWIGPAVSILLIVPLLLSLALETRRQNQIPGVRPEYFQIGQWLAENTSPEDAVATIEIGVIGYESRRPIVDTMGLVSSDMTNHQVGWTETLTYALEAYAPRYLVGLPDTAWDALRQQWWFHLAYEPVATFEKATIFQRKDQPERLLQPVDLHFQRGLQITDLLLSADTLQADSQLDIWLKVQVEQQQSSDYQVTLYLVDAQSNWFAITKDFPFGGTYNSTKWQAGDVLEIPMRLTLPPDLPPGAYQIGFIVFDPTLGEGISLADTPELRSPDIRAGWLRLGSPPTEDFLTAVPLQLDVVWQQSLTLEAINIGQATETLPIQLVWRAGQPLTRNLTTFVHLLDAKGNMLAQVDERPFQGQWPTTVWQADETIFQLLNVPLPEGTSGENVQLRVGLYDENGRLPLAHSSDDFWQFAVDLQPTLP